MDKLESGVSTGPTATGGSGAAERAEPLLQMRGITKSFFGVPVLDAVDLDVMVGEVHAVVGENGAGKSTLMKILAGAYQPDAGSILLDGEEVHFGHPRQAQERGVSIIYQEFNLLPERTVAQNIFLGREPARTPVDNRAMEEATARLLAELGAEGAISPDSLVRELSVAQQQTVEIAKALSFEAGSWSWMSRPPRFHRMRSTPSSSGCGSFRSVVWRGQISHRLKEIFELSRRITILKDGRKVDTIASDSVRPGELVRMMVGRELDHYFPPRAGGEEIGPVRLQVCGGTVRQTA